MTGTGSAAFQAFVASFEAPLTNRASVESFNVWALGRLEGVERDKAEEMLLSRLSKVVDGRVPAALAVLGSTAAVPALRAAAERSEGSMLVAVINALRELGAADESDAQRLIDTLRLGVEPARTEATSSLKYFEGPAVDDALLGALTDEEEMVRLSASLCLFAKYDLDRFAEPPQSRLGVLGFTLQSSLSCVFDEAVNSLRSIIARLSAGDSPESIGLPYSGDADDVRLSRFTESFEDTDDFDVEAVRTLAGDDRDWAGQVLIFFLGESDLRAPRAMAELGWEVFIEPLLEILPRLEGPMKTEAQAALKRLQS